MIKFRAFILLSLILNGCINTSSQKVVKPVDRSDEVILVNHKRLSADEESTLLQRVKKGDTLAYGKISHYYLMKVEPEPLFYYAVLIANRCNYARAFFDAYFVLSHPTNGESFDEQDGRTKALALYYLSRSYELGYKSAISEVDDLKSNNISLKKPDYYIRQYSAR